MAQTKDYTWGFMLENTLFMEFDLANHSIIENAYQQKKLKQASHHIVIHDSHLPCDAKIYFGVAQIHLRMPGTRYYVKRKSIPVVPNKKKETSTFHFPQTYSTPLIQVQQIPRPPQYNQRRRHSQTPYLTRRSSNNHLYQQQKQVPVPTQSVSLTFPLSLSSSSSSSSSSASSTISDPASNPMTMAPSFLSTNNTLDYSTVSNDAFVNLWNYSWLDSLYATTSSTTSALLIPWSTTPPPTTSGTMINHQ
ncbi:hypothetical protein BC941DRAFT_476437 [Chlamydoabsidia padenii]|nr:hypothetical protein BC941DRAFT_476437 [Chlamydoabsidia padenii]